MIALRSVHLVPWLAMLVLAGCGDSSKQTAVAACKAAVLTKIEGKMGEIDDGDMLRNTRALDDGNIEVNSVVTFRRGTDQESEQTFSCVVATDSSGAHKRIIGMKIDW